MKALPGEAPYPNAIDPVPSIMGKVRKGLWFNAFWKPPHWS
jgi:hypothetical protein